MSPTDRKDQRPKLVLTFEDKAGRQAFLDGLLQEMKTPPADRKPLWKFVASWNCGGSLR